MKTSKKALIQNPEGRGYMNGEQGRLSNHSGEVTFNVVLGINPPLSNYKFLGQLKFSNVVDAKEYLSELGATEGTEKNKEYFSLCKQDGCALSSLGFFIIK
jgi:hypothetical protein